MTLNWQKLNSHVLASCRAYLDFIVMDVRNGKLSLEEIVAYLMFPHQPELNRDLTPMEHVEMVSVMLALALDELAKHQRT